MNKEDQLITNCYNSKYSKGGISSTRSGTVEIEKFDMRNYNGKNNSYINCDNTSCINISLNHTKNYMENDQKLKSQNLHDQTNFEGYGLTSNGGEYHNENCEINSP